MVNVFTVDYGNKGMKNLIAKLIFQGPLLQPRSSTLGPGEGNSERRETCVRRQRTMPNIPSDIHKCYVRKPVKRKDCDDTPPYALTNPAGDKSKA